jgi:repressor LexA
VIQDFVRQWGYPPTHQQLADLLGIKPASAQDQIRQLVRKGYLRRDPGRARGLAVVRGPDEPVGDFVGVPVVGSVAAGGPLFSEENIQGEVLVDAAVAAKGRCFALRVTGDSMKKAGIREGDLVIVRQQPLAEKNDIVVALVDGEATVKRLFIQDQVIELRPDNAKYRPIAIGPDMDLRIMGKVVAVRRSAKAAGASARRPRT